MAINWKPFSPRQRDFIRNANAKMNIATGSVRAGKTIACTIRWINYLLTGPQADYAMLGKSLGTLKRNVINDLFEILGKENAKWVDRQQGEMLILGKRVYAIGAATEEAEEPVVEETVEAVSNKETTEITEEEVDEIIENSNNEDMQRESDFIRSLNEILEELENSSIDE